MEDAGLSFLTRWQNFYVIIGTAAATLTGLMFVATTLISRVRTPAAPLRAAFEAFATPIVVQFGVPLLVSAAVSAPWQALWEAGLLLALTGLGAMTLTAIALRWEHRQTGYRATPADWLWYRIAPGLAYLALVIAGIGLARGPVLALYLVAAVTVALLFIGIRNAWDSVTFLAIEQSQGDRETRG